MTNYKKISSHIFLTGIIGIFIYLGFWQLERLNQKKVLIEKIKFNLENPPIDLDKINNPELYSKIKITGHFLNKKDIYLYGRRAGVNEKDGYYLLSPFKTDQGKIIIVSRGWFTRSNKYLIENINNINEEEIIGIVFSGEKKKTFIPENDKESNVWLTLDLEEMSKYFGYNLENYYLMYIGANNPLPNIIVPIQIKNFTNIRNDHLEYAITWFAMAFALFVGFIYFNYMHKLIPK